MNGNLSIEKIEKLKKIKAILENPLYEKKVSSRAKKFMALLETIYPEISVKPEELKVEIPEWEKAKELAIKKGYQAELAGITEPESTYGTLVKKGYLPEFRGKTFAGKMGTGFLFSLDKLFKILQTPERTLGAMWAETAKRAGAKEKYMPGYKPELPTEFKFAPPKFRKWEDIAAALKVGGKELIRPFIPREPGEPEYIGWASAAKEALPWTWLTKQFEYAEKWGAEEAPWYKKAVAGLAGSPADIIGLYFDILTPPFLYTTLGARGAKIGVSLSDDLLTKGGKVLLPKGTPLVLTKLGKEVVEEGTSKTLPRVLNFVSSIISKGKPLTKTAKLLKEVPKEILEKSVKIKVTEGVIRNTVKNMPYEEAAKLIDFGGLKWGGKTVIPGYKISKAFKPLITKIEQVPLANYIEEMFWTRKGFPEAMRPLRTIVKTQMRYRCEEGARLIQDIFKDLSKSELDDVGKYIWMNSDIALYTARGKNIPAKLLSQLDEITGKLNPKQFTAARRYDNEFVKDFLAKFEKELKIQYPELAKYYPARYMYERAGWARRVVGAERAPFEETKRLFYLQAQKMIKEGKIRPKDIISASMQRTFESTTRSGRAMMLQEIKRFASPIKKAGFTSVKGIPELKGWYMADEFIEPLLKVEKAFYGDEAFRWTMKVVDKGLDVWRKAALFTLGYHWRNFWTDMISGSMEYGPIFLKPRYWIEALNIQRRKHIPIKSLAGMYGDEAYDLFAKTGAKSGGWYAEEAGKGVYRGIWSSRNTPFALSRRAGIFREDLGRIVSALIEKEKGSSIESIVEQVGKVFFHYWDITQFERQFGRRFLNPFWCVDIETEALTKKGWKKYNEIKVGDEIFTVNINTEKIELQKNNKVAVFAYNGDLVQLKNRNIDILMTPNHRCIYHKRNHEGNWDKLGWRIREAKDLCSNDFLPIATNGWVGNKKEIYSDDFIRLIGWIVCEGYMHPDNGINITQLEGNNANEIRNCLKMLGYKYSDNLRKDGNTVNFYISNKNTIEIRKIINKEKDLPIEFILALTKKQMEILYDTMIKGDGLNSGHHTIFSQKNDITADNFQILCTLIGRSAKLTKKTKFSKGRFSNKPINCVRVKKIKNICVNNSNRKYIKYNGKIWCPSTLNGTAIFRRNGIVFPSGQTWYSKNIRRQVELLFTRPGAYAAIPKVATFVEGMSKMPEGYQEYKPEYFSDLFVILTPFRTQDGIPLALNPNFAFQDWSRLSLKDFASSLNPMLKIPIELYIAKKEIFFNKPIREGVYVEAPSLLSWCKKLPDDLISNFGMKVKKDGKLYMTEPAMYIWKQNPLFYNLMRLYPATEKPKTPYDWLAIMAGIKFFPYEEDKNKQYYYQRFVEEVNKRIAAEEFPETIGAAGEVIPGYEIPEIPEIEYAYRQIYGEEVGKKYNIEKIKLIKALLALRGGKKFRGAKEALKLIEEPYEEEILKTKGKSIGELKAMLESLGIKPTMEEVKTTLSK